VVVSWLGYPGTLGEPRMADYLIGDPVVSPLAHQADYSETLALMPHCYQPTDAARPVAATPTREQAGLPSQGFVFCSFNQIYKLTPDVFDAWCQIVKGVPGSVLWLLQGTPLAMQNLQREAAQRGLAPERLVFAPKLPQAQHLARLALADLALDTAPYTSHTTGSDALWMGVPLITREGHTFGERVAASLLHAVGLPQLISPDQTRYVHDAIALAHNPGQLALYRQHLQTNRAACPLFNTASFTRHLEALYQTLRAQNLAGIKEPFTVPANQLH
jgi:protein O-GlcNAc transferase